MPDEQYPLTVTLGSSLQLTNDSIHENIGSGTKGKVMKRNWLPQAIASGMLLWALYPGNPSGYYTLLHWVCCGILIYLAYQAGNKAIFNHTIRDRL